MRLVFVLGLLLLLLPTVPAGGNRRGDEDGWSSEDYAEWLKWLCTWWHFCPPPPLPSVVYPNDVVLATFPDTIVNEGSYHLSIYYITDRASVMLAAIFNAQGVCVGQLTATNCSVGVGFLSINITTPWLMTDRYFINAWLVPANNYSGRENGTVLLRRAFAMDTIRVEVSTMTVYRTLHSTRECPNVDKESTSKVLPQEAQLSLASVLGFGGGIGMAMLCMCVNGKKRRRPSKPGICPHCKGDILPDTPSNATPQTTQFSIHSVNSSSSSSSSSAASDAFKHQRDASNVSTLSKVSKNSDGTSATDGRNKRTGSAGRKRESSDPRMDYNTLGFEDVDTDTTIGFLPELLDDPLATTMLHHHDTSASFSLATMPTNDGVSTGNGGPIGRLPPSPRHATTHSAHSSSDISQDLNGTWADSSSGGESNDDDFGPMENERELVNGLPGHHYAPSGASQLRMHDGHLRDASNVSSYSSGSDDSTDRDLGDMRIRQVLRQPPTGDNATTVVNSSNTYARNILSRVPTEQAPQVVWVPIQVTTLQMRHNLLTCFPFSLVDSANPFPERPSKRVEREALHSSESSIHEMKRNPNSPPNGSASPNVKKEYLDVPALPETDPASRVRSEQRKLADLRLEQNLTVHDMNSILFQMTAAQQFNQLQLARQQQSSASSAPSLAASSTSPPPSTQPLMLPAPSVQQQQQTNSQQQQALQALISSLNLPTVPPPTSRLPSPPIRSLTTVQPQTGHPSTARPSAALSHHASVSSYNPPQHISPPQSPPLGFSAASPVGSNPTPPPFMLNGNPSPANGPSGDTFQMYANAIARLQQNGSFLPNVTADQQRQLAAAMSALNSAMSGKQHHHSHRSSQRPMQPPLNAAAAASPPTAAQGVPRHPLPPLNTSAAQLPGGRLTPGRLSPSHQQQLQMMQQNNARNRTPPGRFPNTSPTPALTSMPPMASATSNAVLPSASVMQSITMGLSAPVASQGAYAFNRGGSHSSPTTPTTSGNHSSLVASIVNSIQHGHMGASAAASPGASPRGGSSPPSTNSSPSAPSRTLSGSGGKRKSSSASSESGEEEKDDGAGAGTGAPAPNKKFFCEVPGCGSSLSTAFSLRRHMKTHGDKPFECHTCNKRFADKPSWTRHMATHGVPVISAATELTRTPGMFYQCHVHGCVLAGKPFSDATGLRNHHRSKHDGHPFPLDNEGVDL